MEHKKITLRLNATTGELEPFVDAMDGPEPPVPEPSNEWQNSMDVRIERVWEHARRNLIFIRLGSKRMSVLPNCVVPDIRDFDVAFNYYSTPLDPALGDIVIAGGLSKFHAAKVFFETYPERIEKYEGVYFIDGDVQLQFDPEEFFLYCETQGFDLAQAALTHNSQSGWQVTRWCPPFEYRMTNFIECMAPYFSRSYLKQMLHTFDWSYSGWGLDYIWGHSSRNVAVVDRFQMYHPPSAAGNSFEYILAAGYHPREELARCLAEVGMTQYRIKQFDMQSKDEWSMAL